LVYRLIEANVNQQLHKETFIVAPDCLKI